MKISTIQRCFTDFEGRAPSEFELAFLDNFIRSRESLPSAHSATSVSTNDPEVAETLRDMMIKRARFYPDYSRPCTFEEAFLMGRDVTSSGKAQSFSMADHKLFTAENDLLAKLNAILNGFSPKICKDGVCVAQNQYLPIKTKDLRPSKRYEVTVVYSSDENCLLSFAENIASSRLSLNSFSSKGNEIFSKICEYSRYLTVDTDLLPSCSHDSLFDNSFGNCAIVVFSKTKRAKKVISLAKKHGLNVCSAINISKDNRLRIMSKGSKLFSFKSVILSGAMGAVAADIKIPDQKPVSKIPSAKKLREIPESNERVYMTDVSLNSDRAFTESISAIISPLVASAYDGLNTQNSEFSISINASLSKNDGASYAALLGIYRAVAELGITVENPHLSMTENQSSISVALRVHSFKEKTSFTSSLSQKDMLKVLVEDKLIPDFEVLRTIINGKNA